MSEPRQDESETAKDIAALQAYRQARLNFNARIVEASRDKDPDVLTALRSDATHQLAEFYFPLSGFGINRSPNSTSSSNAITTISHPCLATPTRCIAWVCARSVCYPQSSTARPGRAKIWSDDPGALDQSTLARFLVAVMSDETARKTVVAC